MLDLRRGDRLVASLFECVPGLRLAVDELSYKHESPVFGVHELPVTW